MKATDCDVAERIVSVLPSWYMRVEALSYVGTAQSYRLKMCIEQKDEENTFVVVLTVDRQAEWQAERIRRDSIDFF